MNGYGLVVRAILAVLLLGAAPALAQTEPHGLLESQGTPIEVPDPAPTGLLIAWKPAFLSVRVDSGTGSKFGDDSLQPLRGLLRYTARIQQDKPICPRC